MMNIIYWLDVIGLFIMYIIFHEGGHYLAVSYFKMNPKLGFDLKYLSVMVKYSYTIKEGDVKDTYKLMKRVNVIGFAGITGVIPFAILSLFDPSRIWIDLILFFTLYSLFETTFPRMNME